VVSSGACLNGEDGLPSQKEGIDDPRVIVSDIQLGSDGTECIRHDCMFVISKGMRKMRRTSCDIPVASMAESRQVIHRAGKMAQKRQPRFATMALEETGGWVSVEWLLSLMVKG